MTRVAVIILNWNNASDTLACLASLSPFPEWASVIVVDNGSSEESVPLLEKQAPGIKLLQSQANLGYAGGNNLGLSYALQHDFDTICILNNDVVVAPDFLDRPLRTLAQRADIGVVTPLIADMAEPDRVWTLGATVNWRDGTVQRSHAGEPVAVWLQQPPFETEIAAGAAIIVRRAVFESAGLLDETFYLYYEEADWCLRVKQAGYKIYAVPASVIWHKVSASLGTRSPLIDYYMLRNQLRFVARHRAGIPRVCTLGRAIFSGLLTIVAFTCRPKGGQCIPSRNARIRALYDAASRRWGPLSPRVSFD